MIINMYKILVEQSEGKFLFVKKIRMWEDKIKVDFRELDCKGYTE